MNADRYRWADDYPSYGRTWMGDALAIGTVLIAVVLLTILERPVLTPLPWEHTVAAALFITQAVLLACYLAIELQLRAVERA